MKTYLFLPIPLPPCTVVSLFLWIISPYYMNQEEISLCRIHLHAILFNISLESGSSHFHPYIYYHFCIVKYFVYLLQFNFNGSGFQESLQCLWRNSWICSKDRSNNSHLLIFSGLEMYFPSLELHYFLYSYLDSHRLAPIFLLLY